MAHGDLQLLVDHTGEETVVRLTGELDLTTAERLSEVVRGELTRGPGPIVVELAGLTFCDSIGLGTLIVLSRAAANQQTYLQLRNPSPEFSHMLEITGVRAGLNITP
jgi:anti-sigma B factor antagonist